MGEGWEKSRKAGGRGFSQTSSPLGSLLTRSSPLSVFPSKIAAIPCKQSIIQHSCPTKYGCTAGNLSVGQTHFWFSIGTGIVENSVIDLFDYVRRILLIAWIDYTMVLD